MIRHKLAVMEALAELGERAASHVAGNALQVLAINPEMGAHAMFRAQLRTTGLLGIVLSESDVDRLATRAAVALERLELAS